MTDKFLSNHFIVLMNDDRSIYNNKSDWANCFMAILELEV